MSGSWGNRIKYTIFGESHGEGIGIVIDNLPPGLELDTTQIKLEMQRRRPGDSDVATPRSEQDEFEFLSGFFNNKTTGAPLCVFIRNTDSRSKDYDDIKHLMRPGHADFTGYMKYKGFNDYRGGGHFSGRLTAVLVFAGAIAKQLLAERNIEVVSHILRIGTASDFPFDEMTLKRSDLSSLKTLSLPTLNTETGNAMREQIASVYGAGDSLGGIVEAAVLNLPAGLGAPFFDSLESTISHLAFSIPGVKGIEFGDGFAFAQMKGSEANDQYYIADDIIRTKTNHNGGVLGGISTGMPLIFRTVFKPTPSIALAQQTVNINTNTAATIAIKGRHDPCIVPRGLPVIEAIAAMAVLELLND